MASPSVSESESGTKIVKSIPLPNDPLKIQRHIVSRGPHSLFRRISFATYDGGKTFEALEEPWWQQKSTIDGEWFNCNESTCSFMENCFQNVWKGSKSPYDRGGADSYYHRPPCPHYYHPFFGKVEAEDMSEIQIEQYHKGYNDNEESGDKKEWE